MSQRVVPELVSRCLPLTHKYTQRYIIFYHYTAFLKIFIYRRLIFISGYVFKVKGASLYIIRKTLLKILMQKYKFQVVDNNSPENRTVRIAHNVLGIWRLSRDNKSLGEGWSSQILWSVAWDFLIPNCSLLVSVFDSPCCKVCKMAFEGLV